MDANESSHKLKSREIPFFPSSLHEKRTNVSVWWFERDFSQSFYGQCASRQSNSCMLIMLLIASRIRSSKIKVEATNGDQLSFNLIKAFAESIVQGNEIYCKLSSAKKLPDINFSIPDAIDTLKVHSNGLKEWFYATINLFNLQNGMKESIFTGLTEGYNRWQQYQSIKKTGNYFFVILIASRQSILFVFEENTSTVTVFDSHQHRHAYGSVIAQTDIQNLKSLCNCIEQMYFEIYETCPQQMELSFLECNEQHPLLYLRKFIRFVE